MPNIPLVRMKFGSHLYGTNTPSSDTDIKAIHIPDTNDLLLSRAKKVDSHSTGGNIEKNTSEDIDFESFSLHHFLFLLMQGQTVAIDMLFAPPEMIEFSTPEWEWIVENKHLFLSKQAEPYIGYCKQQANKYGIKGSRVSAVRTVLEFLKSLTNNKDRIGDWSEELTELIQNLEASEIVGIVLANGQTIQHLSVCNRKIPFTSSVKEGINIYQRVFDEYGKRAIQAESNEGVDWKALSHAVRVGMQAISLFRDHEIEFPLPYAEYLLAIKTGKLDYKVVSEVIEDLLEKVEKAAKESTLPEYPDYAAAEKFILKTYRNVLTEEVY